MDVWSWICELPFSDNWVDSTSQLSLELASSKSSLSNKQINSTSPQFIELKARPTFGSNSDLLAITFYVCHGQDTLWVSDTCPLSSDKPFLPLILQLLQEIISRSPAAQVSTCPRSQLQKLKSDPVAWILDSHSPESFAGFFNLIFTTRLFWLCVFDAPSDVGSLFFHSLLAPNLEAFSCKHAPVLRAFFIAAGVDVELCLTRTFGYMIAKWLILKELGVGLQLLTPSPSHNLGSSYAMEAHGLWVLKGYVPVLAMRITRSNSGKNLFPMFEAQESVLRYALAHQQLEAVVQLEYTVGFFDNYIQVSARVDNLRLHVAKLGFNKNGDDDYVNERHFPSRVRVWVGPEVGASYVTSLSLGQATDNVEKEAETQKIVKGSFGKQKVPKVKAMTRTTTRTRVKNWRWDQDSEGNTAIFDATLCDNTTGVEIAMWKTYNNNVDNNGGSGDNQGENNFRGRYAGANRSFTKSGSLVFAGDGWGEGVKWRLNKEMEGSVLKWRIGGQVWVSYFPNEVRSSYCETRCVEWCDEVDLPLITC